MCLRAFLGFYAYERTSNTGREGKQSQSKRRCLGDNPSGSLGLWLQIPIQAPPHLSSSSLISSSGKLIYKWHYPLVPTGLEIPLALLLYYSFLSVGTQENNVILNKEGQRPWCPFLRYLHACFEKEAIIFADSLCRGFLPALFFPK